MRKRDRNITPSPRFDNDVNVAVRITASGDALDIVRVTTIITTEMTVDKKADNEAICKRYEEAKPYADARAARLLPNALRQAMQPADR